MKNLTLLCVAISLLVLSGCNGNTAIDVSRANELIRNGDSGETVSIDVLIKEFGEPNSITSAQRKRLKEFHERINLRGAPERNYDNAKVWGNNTAFVVVFTNDDGIIRGHSSIGGGSSR